MGLVDPLDDERRVLLLQPVEPGHQLVLVALRLGPDGDRQRRPARRRDGNDDRRALGGQRVAGADVGQLGHGHDVAGPGLGRPAGLLAPQELEDVEALVACGCGGW